MVLFSPFIVTENQKLERIRVPVKTFSRDQGYEKSSRGPSKFDNTGALNLACELQNHSERLCDFR
jgi:hypothetical protein